MKGLLDGDRRWSYLTLQTDTAHLGWYAKTCRPHSGSLHNVHSLSYNGFGLDMTDTADYDMALNDIPKTRFIEV